MELASDNLKELNSSGNTKSIFVNGKMLEPMEIIKKLGKNIDKTLRW